MNPFLESQKYFKTPLQQLQFFDKYSRWDDKINRRETWIETVDRTVNYLKELSQNKLLENEYELIRQHILEMKVMPSMRLLAMAGSAAKRNNICLYNCSFMGIDSIACFHEALLISMCGCGVGFSVESKYINQLPYLPATLDYGFTTYDIEDTTEGWVDSIKILFGNLYTGIIPHFDYSHIRKAGTPLKTKGGRASGPEILKETIEFIIDTFLENYEPLFGGGWARTKNLQLKPIQVHDIMCSIGNCAISGGTRRSAMISLFDFGDEEMLHAKDTDNIKYRWNSNNSAVWDHDLTREEFDNFMQVVFNSNRGEPGIFNLYGVQNYQQELAPRRIHNKIRGVNPSLRSGTLIYTTDGIFPIEQLENKKFNIRNLNGSLSSAECFLSGKNKPLYKIVLEDGSYYYATAEHKWPVIDTNGVIDKYTTDTLKPGMLLPTIPKQKSLEYGSIGSYNEGFLLGWIIGDGWVTIRGDNSKTQVGMVVSSKELYIKDKIESILLLLGVNAKFSNRNNGTWELNTQNKILDELLRKYQYNTKQDGLPKSVWGIANEEFRKGLIDGLFSSDGSVDKSGRVCITSAHYKLIIDIKTLLGFYGINSFIQKREISNQQFPNGKDYNKIYTNYVLRFGKYDDVNHFSSVFRLSHIDKYNRIYAKKKPKHINYVRNTNKIKKIELTDILENVWDITVYDDTHCFQLATCITGNCGEIQLQNNQFCNLTSVIARSDDTKESLLIKIQVAALIGTIQSMATYFPGLRDIWKQNCEEERLLGVDLNGQMDCPILLNDDGKFREHLRETAILTNQIYAKKLGINQSTAVTAVKPNGNSGVLVDAASGLHPRYSKYYIRNFRIDITSPLYRVLFESGAPINPENGQDWSNLRTAVVSFPVKAPDNCVTRHDLTAIELAEFWKLNKVYYTEHNPSVTIYYDEHEKEELSNWLWENRNILGGITVLPKDNSNYKLMPYEEITEEEYYKRLKEFPEINWSKLEEYELEDMTKATHELACSSGSCEI